MLSFQCLLRTFRDLSALCPRKLRIRSCERRGASLEEKDWRTNDLMQASETGGGKSKVFDWKCRGCEIGLRYLVEWRVAVVYRD